MQEEFARFLFILQHCMQGSSSSLSFLATIKYVWASFNGDSIIRSSRPTNICLLQVSAICGDRLKEETILDYKWMSIAEDVGLGNSQTRDGLENHRPKDGANFIQRRRRKGIPQRAPFFWMTKFILGSSYSDGSLFFFFFFNLVT